MAVDTLQKELDALTRTRKMKVYRRSWKERNPIKVFNDRLDYASSGRKRKNNRDWHLRNKYGITDIQFQEMLKAQNNLCALCQCNLLEKERKICVDHDHELNVVRALLCSACNNAIGLFCDDVSLLQRAIEYIQFHKQKVTK